jgi:hypothetical protein
MAFLFLIFTIAILLLWAGYRRTALVLTLINLLLCLAMFWHHVTDKLQILL